MTGARVHDAVCGASAIECMADTEGARHRPWSSGVRLQKRHRDGTRLPISASAGCYVAGRSAWPQPQWSRAVCGRALLSSLVPLALRDLFFPSSSAGAAQRISPVAQCCAVVAEVSVAERCGHPLCAPYMMHSGFRNFDTPRSPLMTPPACVPSTVRVRELSILHTVLLRALGA